MPARFRCKAPAGGRPRSRQAGSFGASFSTRGAMLAPFIALALAFVVQPVSAGDTPQASISTRTMLSRLEQPWVQLIDVRSPEEYAGRDVRTLRGGHIPGAINLPLAEVMGGERPSRLAALERRKETIVYGRDAEQGARAAEQLRKDGFRDVRVYAEAWQVWGNTLELPVAEERFADVGALRAQLDALHRKLEQLSDLPAVSRSTPAASQLIANR
jgi:rhodanese-related sulfurtransferase